MSDGIETWDIVAAVRNAPAPVVNTTYLTGEFDVPREMLRERLDELVTEGVLEHTEARNRGHLWWLSVGSELDE